MTLSMITGAAVLLALTPAALAGGATVVNNCNYPIYYASVGQSQHAEMQALTGTFSQPFNGGTGNGISIKLSPTKDGAVTQFEYTPGADGKMFYDISNIDGNPFSKEGMSLVPSGQNDPNNPTCVPIVCPAGQSSCDAAYNQPDDVRTHVCAGDTDLVFTVCPNGSPASPESSSSDDSSSSAAPSSAPTATTGDVPTEPAASESAVAEPSASAAAGGWKPPTKRAEHVHHRVHSRSFRV